MLIGFRVWGLGFRVNIYLSRKYSRIGYMTPIFGFILVSQVVSWGASEDGGDSSAVQDRLKNLGGFWNIFSSFGFIRGTYV